MWYARLVFMMEKMRHFYVLLERFNITLHPASQPSVMMRVSLFSVSTWQSLKENEGKRKSNGRQWVTIYWFYCIVLVFFVLTRTYTSYVKSAPAWIASLWLNIEICCIFFRQWAINITICRMLYLIYIFKCFPQDIMWR